MKFTKEDIEKAFKTNVFEESLLVLQVDGNKENYIEYAVIEIPNIQLTEKEIIAWINEIDRFKEFYTYESTQPLRIRLKNHTYPISILNPSKAAQISCLEDVYAILSKKFNHFDVQSPPLFNVLIANCENSSYIGLAYHHLLFDGVSVQLAMSKLDPLNNIIFSEWSPKIENYSNSKCDDILPFKIEEIIPPASSAEQGYFKTSINFKNCTYEDLMISWVDFVKAASGKTTYVIGEVFSARGKESESNNSLGYYIQTWPIIFDNKSSQTELIQQRNNIREKSHLPVNEHYPPNLFDHCWVVEPKIETGYKIEFYSTTHYALTIIFKPDGKDIDVNFVWNLEKTNKEAAQEITQSFERFIDNNNTSSIQKPIAKHNYSSILDLWIEVVKKHPSKAAIEDHTGEKLTYQELEDKANKLASWLNIKHQQCIGVNTSYSTNIIVAFLAILKRGGIYIPLDPAASNERINYIIEDAKIETIISDRNSNLGCETIDPNQIVEINKDFVTNENLKSIDDSCYLIYTSGTTGNPKGCSVTHKNLLNLFLGTKSCFEFKTSDHWIMAHSFGFDFSTWEIWGSLLNSGTLYIPKREDVQDTFTFHELLKEKNITILNQTPKSFYNLILVDEDSHSLNSLRYVIFGGDKLTPARLTDWRDLYPETKLINMYGITETTVHVTLNEIKNEIHSKIGKPLPGYFIRLINDAGDQIPRGFLGEILVSGNGVCNGYYNKEELTKEIFIENGKSYRSGDIGWQINDQFYYLGRRDRQVKIRGYRIELGEIEFLLKKKFKENDFIVHSFKEDSLICFYKGKGNNLSANDFKNYLPDYSIPRQFIHLDNFPLNQSGKVDEDQLKKHLTKINKKDSLLNGKEKLTKDLSDPFIEILGDQIDFSKSFIQNGGDSISAIRLINKLKKQRYTVTVKELFEQSSIENLNFNLLLPEDSNKNYLDEFQKTISEKADNTVYFPLLESQEGILFECLKSLNNELYVEQLIFEIPAKYTVEQIEFAYTEVCNKNPILLAYIERKEEKYLFSTNLNLRININLITNPSLVNFIQEDLQAGLDIHQNLSRLSLKVGYDKHEIVWTHHHLILDGWSLPVFCQQMMKALNNEQIEYSDKFIQLSCQNYFENEKSNFWKKLTEFNENEPFIPHQPDRNKDKSYLKLNYQINRPQESNSMGMSQHAFIFGAWTAFINSLFKKDKFSIGNVVSLRGDDDIDEMGMYIRTLPFADTFNSKDTFERYVNRCFNLLNEQSENKHKNINEFVQPNQLSHLFVFENYPVNIDFLKEKEIRIIDYNEKTNAEWTTIVYPNKNGYEFSILYETSFYSTYYVQSILEHFNNWINNLNWQKTLSSSIDNINTEKVFGNNLFCFQDTDFNIINILKKSSKQAAIISSKGTMSYSQLWETSKKLSIKLHDKGLNKGEVVGLDVSTTTNFTISILAIWMCGGIVCSVDQRYPKKRKDFIFKNCKLRYIILEENNGLEIKNINDSFTILDEKASFILHTSGSTGTPKGVIQTHDCLTNLINWNKSQFNLNCLDRILQLSSFGFDASYHEVLLALSLGASLIEVPLESRLDISEIKHHMNQHQGTMAWIPARLLNAILDTNESFFDDCETIKNIVTTGEALFVGSMLKSLLERKNINLLNYYGPTETHVITSKLINNSNISAQPTIGEVLPNCEVLLMDLNSNKTPIGIPGEIWASGPQIALGYLNDDDLTQSKFITYEEKRWYKTGDWAYADQHQNFHFIGRKDDQVKIRGFRVEPTEIERIITESNDVNQCCVLIIEQQIIAFTVSQTEITKIKSRCKQFLPDYMQPSHWMELEQIPLNSNGKADRKILEKIWVNEDKNDIVNLNKSAASECWRAVLNHSNFSSESTFQTVGGNSILLMKSQAWLEKNINLFITIKELLQHDTPTLLDKLIDDKAKIELKNIPESFPLNVLQKNILISELGNTFEEISPFVLCFDAFLKIDITQNQFQELVLKLLIQYPYLAYVICDANKPKEAYWQSLDNSIEKLFKPLENPVALSEPLIRFIYVKENHIRFEWHHILLDGLGLSSVISSILKLLDGDFTHKKYPIDSLLNFPVKQSLEKIKTSFSQSKSITRTLSEDDLQKIETYIQKNNISLSSFCFASVGLASEKEFLAITDIKSHPGIPGMFTEILGIKLNLNIRELSEIANFNYLNEPIEIDTVINFMSIQYNSDIIDRVHSRETLVTKYPFEWQFINENNKLEVAFYFDSKSNASLKIFESWNAHIDVLLSGKSEPNTSSDSSIIFSDFDF